MNEHPYATEVRLIRDALGAISRRLDSERSTLRGIPRLRRLDSASVHITAALGDIDTFMHVHRPARAEPNGDARYRLYDPDYVFAE